MSETETKKVEDLIGKVYQYRENIYILCTVLSAGGKCVGPVILDITYMPKQQIIDECLDLINKYGEQEVLTKLLNKLNKV